MKMWINGMLILNVKNQKKLTISYLYTNHDEGVGKGGGRMGSGWGKGGNGRGRKQDLSSSPLYLPRYMLREW